jgi:hypothetical protein
MAASEERSVPAGAGVFPLIPQELNIHPLLLAVLHATVFLSASDEKLVDADAADEAFDYMAGYLRRLRGAELGRIRLDLEALAEFGRQEKWSAEAIEFLETFLDTCGVPNDEAK